MNSSCSDSNNLRLIQNNLKSDTTSITKNDISLNDTFFLLKRNFPTLKANYQHYVYKTTEPNFYDLLKPRFCEKDFTLINHPYTNPIWKNYRYKVPIGDIPTKWTEVLFYENEYYLKYPSDFCNLKQKIISDSCLISITCEGPIPSKITKISRLNNKQYLLILGFDEDNQKRTTITIIDTVRGIAVWHSGENEFNLFADTDRFKNIPIAKADCNRSKCPYELKSQKLDYLGLIND